MIFERFFARRADNRCEIPDLAELQRIIESLGQEVSYLHGALDAARKEAEAFRIESRLWRDLLDRRAAREEHNPHKRAHLTRAINRSAGK